MSGQGNVQAGFQKTKAGRRAGKLEATTAAAACPANDIHRYRRVGGAYKRLSKDEERHEEMD